MTDNGAGQNGIRTDTGAWKSGNIIGRAFATVEHL